MKFTELFSQKSGGPSQFYRIPSLVTTKNGVVIACADARYCSISDNPNRIDKVIRRSMDSGETWGDYQIVVQEYGTEQMGASAAIDPILTCSEETGRVFMHYCHTPAGIGINNCKCGTGEDTEGNRIIKSGSETYICRQGQLYRENGEATGWLTAENGDVEEQGVRIGNIYTGERFKEEETAWLMMCYSDDDGLTWSEPQSLNRQVKREYMNFIGACPGNGIVAKHGRYRGRILVPVYYGTALAPLRLSCCVIFSDDNGLTWTLGDSPNNNRMSNGRKLDCFSVTEEECLTESQLIEQEDGTLKLFMRNHDTRRCTAVAYSRDGGESWEDFAFDEKLPQPVCQMSVIKLSNTRKPCVVFMNPADQEDRRMGTVRLSEDDGETFSYSRVVMAGLFGYCSLTQLPDGKIGAFMEIDPDQKALRMVFTRFSLDWIRGKEEDTEVTIDL